MKNLIFQMNIIHSHFEQNFWDYDMVILVQQQNKKHWISYLSYLILKQIANKLFLQLFWLSVLNFKINIILSLFKNDLMAAYLTNDRPTTATRREMLCELGGL